MRTVVAPSCRAVLDQANALWPNRSRASDGLVGNPRHRKRKSDHNPDRHGHVHAVDLTHDPAHGCDAHKLAKEIAARRDPRVAYIISFGKIFSRRFGVWGWRLYSGPNPHTKHIHISIHHNDLARRDTSPWFREVVEPMFSPPLSMPPIVATLKHPKGGVALLGEDGSVWAFDCPYEGAPNGKAYFAGRKAARLIYNPKFPRRGTGKPWYVVVATTGEEYGHGGFGA